MNIYTLGYAGRSQDEFLRLLHNYEIKCVVDIRSNPSSKVEYFDRKHLKNELESRRINYSYLGDELGGFRKGGFAAYTQTAEFQMGLVILKEIAMKSRTAIICFEKLPSECHRRFIAEALEREGWKVAHILD